MTMYQYPTHPNLRPFKGIQYLIGNTPLLAINFTYNGKKLTLYAKAEHMNLTGSIKDRMALHILRTAYAEKKLHPQDTIVEVTSGNTGISFAGIGKALGHKVILFIPDWMSKERFELIESLGAQINKVSHDEGGFVGAIKLSENYAKQNKDIFLPRQFANNANVQAHELTTGPEILWQLHFQSLTPDAFVAGVGTGGTIMGVGRFLHSFRKDIKIFPVEPSEAPILTTGYYEEGWKHRIQGITDEFIPEILKLTELEKPVSIPDGDAILMARKLAHKLGLGVGISSGCNFLAALKVLEKLGPDAIVVTVFADDNKKYLSTDLFNHEEPIRTDYLTPQVEFTDYHVFNRVCYPCSGLYHLGQRETV